MFETPITFIQALYHSDVYAVTAFASWFATFIAGENGALFSIIFALQGFIPVSDALLFSFLGSLSADLFWYGVTISTIRPWLDRRIKKKMSEGKMEEKPLFSVADKYPYVVLVFIKFLVGIRLLLTIYIVAKRKIHFHLYLLCNVLANILFIGVLYGLVWSLNTWTDRALETSQNITHFIAAIVVVGIGVHILFRIFEHYLIGFFKRHEHTDL